MSFSNRINFQHKTTEKSKNRAHQPLGPGVTVPSDNS